MNSISALRMIVATPSSSANLRESIFKVSTELTAPNPFTYRLYASVPVVRIMTTSPPPLRAIIHRNASSTSAPPPMITNPLLAVVCTSSGLPTIPMEADRVAGPVGLGALGSNGLGASFLPQEASKTIMSNIKQNFFIKTALFTDLRNADCGPYFYSLSFLLQESGNNIEQRSIPISTLPMY